MSPLSTTARATPPPRDSPPPPSRASSRARAEEEDARAPRLERARDVPPLSSHTRDASSSETPSRERERDERVVDAKNRRDSSRARFLARARRNVASMRNSNRGMKRSSTCMDTYTSSMVSRSVFKETNTGTTPRPPRASIRPRRPRAGDPSRLTRARRGFDRSIDSTTTRTTTRTRMSAHAMRSRYATG